MRISVKAHETELKQLFKEIFEESSFFTNLIFEKKLSFSHCFAKKENGEIASFLFGMEKNARIGESIVKCIYIYGVGTKEKYRKKGLSKSLLNEAYEYFSNSGAAFLYLVPAKKELFTMYEKQGFKTEFYLDKSEIELKADFSATVPSNGDYYMDYCIFSKKFDNIILMSEKDCSVTLEYTKYLKINKSGFLYEEDGSTAFIRECFVENEADLEDFLKFLGKKFKKAYISRPFGQTPYAMLKPCGDFSLKGTRYTNMNFD